MELSITARKKWCVLNNWEENFLNCWIPGAWFTSHQYSPAKSDNIGYGQDPKLQDSWSSPNKLNTLLPSP